MDTTSPSPLPVALKRQWWGVVGLFGLAALGGYVVFYTAWHPTRAGHWGIGASGALLYVLGYTRFHLPLNRSHPNGAVLSRLGVGNRLTLLRGLMYGLLAGFLVLPPPTGLWAWVPGFLYTAASLTDLLDGRLARRRGETTDLGAKLDVEVDSIGIFVAFALAVKFGQLPAYFVGVGTLFYAYRLIVWVWTRQGGETQDPPPRRWRSVVGGFEVGFLCVVLWPVFAPPLTTAVATAVVVPVILSFVWDGLITTGLVDLEGDTYRSLVVRFERWAASQLPALLRIVTVGCSVWYMVAAWPTDPISHFVLQHVLMIFLFVSSCTLAVGRGGWESALGMLSAGAFLSLTGPTSLMLIAFTTGSFWLMMISLGENNH